MSDVQITMFTLPSEGEFAGAVDRMRLDRQSHALAHSHDPQTSRDAAARNASGKASNRRLCLDAHAIVQQGTGLTDDEVADLTRIELHEARRRCTDLRNAGLLVFTDRTRESSMGRQSTVSVLTPAGREALA